MIGVSSSLTHNIIAEGGDDRDENDDIGDRRLPLSCVIIIIIHYFSKPLHTRALVV